MWTELKMVQTFSRKYLLTKCCALLVNGFTFIVFGIEIPVNKQQCKSELELHCLHMAPKQVSVLKKKC